MEDQKMIHAIRSKEWAAKRADKPPVPSKRMSSRQASDIHGNGALTRPRHHQPVPSQYRSGRSWVRGKRGYGLTMGRRESLFWGSHLNSFGEKCPAGMTYHPKEGMMSWNH